MDELDGRIRAALADLARPVDVDQVRAIVRGRLGEMSAPGFTSLLGLTRRGVMAVASFAVVIAVAGAVLVLQPSPAMTPSTASPPGSAMSVSETATPPGGGPLRLAWTRQPLDRSVVGIGGMESIAQGPAGLVAAGWFVDTGHHHDTATSKRPHMEAVVWTSPDGRAWHRIDQQPGFEHATITSIGASGDFLLAVGRGDDDDGGQSPRVWRSTDGSEWSLLSPSGLPAGASLGRVTPLAKDFLLEVTVSRAGMEQAGSLWRSADGLAWQEVVLGDYLAIAQRTVFDTGPGYVAVGRRVSAGLGPVVSRSTDGLVWESVDVADDAFGTNFVGLDDIIAERSGFIAAGRVVDTVSPQDPGTSRPGPPTDGAIWTSPDLATWTRVEPSRELFGGEHDQGVHLLEAIGGGYVALGASDAAGAGWASTDGATWHRLSDAAMVFSHGSPAAVQPVGSELVAVGSDGQDGPAVWLGHVVATAPGAIGDVEHMLAALQGAGASVAVTERFVPMPDVLGRDGRRLCVDGQRVDAYVFSTAAEAAAVAASIDRDDPSHIGPATIIEWAGDPRFWLTGQVLVLYVGPEPATEHVLTAVLGPAFARGSGRFLDPTQFDC